MMRSKTIGQWMAVLAVGALLLPATQVSAAEVEAPQGALAPGTTFVMWADAAAFNERSVSEAMQAVIAAAPASERDRMTTEYDEQMADIQPMLDAATQLREDGVLSGVMSIVPQDGPEGSTALSQLFLRTKPGSDPKAAVDKAARAMNAWMQENKPEDAIDEAELDTKLEKAKYTKINGQWYAVEVEDEDVAPLPDPAEAADPAPFVEAMRKEDGAPVRFAFVMNDGMKQQLQQAAASPNMAMMAGMITPLTDMATATGGLWLGDEPRLRISLNFNEEANATAFKTSADGMMQFMGQMMAAQGAQGANGGQGQAPDMEKIQAVLPLLMFDHQSNTVSKTLNIGLLEKLTEAGIPWYQDN